MQIIDILGDDADQTPPGLQFRQGVVGRVGPGPGDGFIHLFQKLPDFGWIAAKAWI
jgi:hypothetical protein